MQLLEKNPKLEKARLKIQLIAEQLNEKKKTKIKKLQKAS
jgi:hypothetical protein